MDFSRLLGCQFQLTYSRFSCLLLQSGIAQGRLWSGFSARKTRGPKSLLNTMAGMGCLINPSIKDILQNGRKQRKKIKG
jgi:hypothetical protein